MTVCPRLVLDYNVSFYVKDRRKSFVYYEKHTLVKLSLEYEEIMRKYRDSKKFGHITYLTVLKRLEEGRIKPEELELATLKSIQVVDFITKRGVFAKLNYSVPTNDILDEFNEFFKEFSLRFDSLIFYLAQQNQEYVAEIITQWGLCFTYNIAFSHDLLYINKTSDDFHYIYGYKMFDKYNLVREEPKFYPQKISSSQAGLWVGFYEEKNRPLIVVSNDFHGYVVLFHDPYELPSRNSKILKFNTQIQTKVFINPQLNSIDESLLDYEPAQYVLFMKFRILTSNFPF